MSYASALAKLNTTKFFRPGRTDLSNISKLMSVMETISLAKSCLATPRRRCSSCTLQGQTARGQWH